MQITSNIIKFGKIYKKCINKTKQYYRMITLFPLATKFILLMLIN